jgi:hypothetical protein
MILEENGEGREENGEERIENGEERMENGWLVQTTSIAHPESRIQDEEVGGWSSRRNYRYTPRATAICRTSPPRSRAR